MTGPLNIGGFRISDADKHHRPDEVIGAMGVGTPPEGASVDVRCTVLEGVVNGLLAQALAATSWGSNVGVSIWNIEPEVAQCFVARRVAEGGTVHVTTRPDVDRPGRVSMDVRVRVVRP